MILLQPRCIATCFAALLTPVIIRPCVLPEHTLDTHRTLPQVRVWTLVFVAIGVVSILATIIQLVRKLRVVHRVW